VIGAGPQSGELRRGGLRRRAAAVVVAVLTVTAAVPLVDAGLAADPAGAATTFTEVAQDTVSGTAQHQSVADNVQAQWGNTIVSVFQMARASLCSCGLSMGWATSKDGGATWSSGAMPGITTSSPAPAGTFARVTDAAVAYDAKHGQWLAVGAVYDAAGNQQAATVNRSDDGTGWGKAIVAVRGNGTTLKPDKTWIACNNFAGANYGHCYLTYANVGASQALGVVVSTDGGISWSDSLVGGGMYDSAPVVQPDGQLVIIGTTGSIGTDGNPNGSLRVARVADDGGALSFTGPVSTVPSTAAAIRTHRPSPMLALAKPSVAVDRTTGRIFVAYHGCQFRTGCTQNDLVLTTTDDGVTFTPLRQLAIDPAGANFDHFDAGIGIDPNTSGATARLGIVFFYYPDATCRDDCAIRTGLTTSSDGGATWTGVITVSSAPRNSDWLVNASQGMYLTDYNAVVFPSATSAPATDLVTAVPWALSAPTGTATSPVLAQHLYAVRTPVATAADAPPVPAPPGPPPPPVTPPEGPPVADGDGSAPGYWLLGGDGRVYPFAGAADLGASAPFTGLGTSVAVGIAGRPDHAGAWIAAADGNVVALGSATDLGDMGATALARPIVGIAATPSGDGYWLVASDGGIFSFGDAAFFGSTGAISLNQPIVGMASTPTGQGYWLVARDGGIFAFGDAAFFGSTGAIHLNQPVVGMWPTPSGHGYWFVASDGGIFSFGDAAFFGSTGDITLNRPIVGMAGGPGGGGYWFVGNDGGVFAFGGVPFLGSLGALDPAPTVTSMSAA
jgi:hypothetical protein